MSAALFERDFEGLELGAGFETPARTITEHDVLAFAELTGDRHPQHIDAAWASESAFGERIAHGTLVVSFAIAMLPMQPDRAIALRAIREVVFKRPTPIGAAIRVEGEIERLRPVNPRTGVVTMALRVRDAADRVLARLTIDALWRRA